VSRLSEALADRYRIERELGAGGMATVYLAQDLKHDRKVAIKVLKPELAAVLGADRFVVEIKTTAAMSHPHILPLFDSGTTDGFLFYVMPYIQGETIREKLNRETQFGVDEAVRIAREVADALDYAHRHGVIHRDIKPENILLHDGRAMVMDFGIALAVSAAAGGRMTETGLSLGTPHYMSPEQATADKEITGRSDVYSLASVLYETLSGVPPHEGGSAQQTIMRIVTETPRPLSTLRKSVPPNVAAAVMKALEKLPADRFDSAKAFGDALGNSSFVSDTRATPVAAAASSRSVDRLLPWAIAALSLALLAGMALREPPPPEPVTLDFVPPGDIQLSTQNRRADFALSPDGATLVFTGLSLDGGVARGTGLYARRMSDGAITALGGSERGSSPFFSPDGRNIGFHRGFSIFRMPVEGGVAVNLPVRDSAFVSGAWGPDGRIVYTANDYTLKAFSAAGQEPTVLTPSLPTDRRGPWLAAPLPDNKGVLFRHCSTGLASSCELAVARPDGKVQELRITALQGWYLPTGHLIYVRQDGTVLGVSFDVAGLRATGEPVPLLDGVSITPDDAAHLAWSPAGTLAYVQGNQFESSSLELIGSNGTSKLITTRTGMFRSPVPSPDGQAVAIRISPPGAGRAFHLWVIDRRTGTLRPLLTDRNVVDVAWSPDGQELAVVADTVRGVGMSHLRLFRLRADGSDTLRGVGMPEGMSLQGSSLDWSPDGRWLIAVRDGANRSDLVAVAADGSREWHLLAGSPAREWGGRLSPDGTRLSYVSDESGVAEVFVRPFLRPGAGVALGARVGLGSPKWQRDGRALVVHDGDSVMVLELTPGPAPRVAVRRTLPAVTAAVQGTPQFALDPGGAGMIVIRPVVRPATLKIVLNWFTDVRRRMEAGR